MADQDDFTFDDQDNDSEEWYEDEPEKKKGGSRSRVLLLLLLLVAIAGGGYYYFMMMPADDGPAAPTKKVVKLKKKAISMPAKQKPANHPVEMPVKKSTPADEPADKNNKVVKSEAPTKSMAPAKADQPKKMPVAKQPVPVQKAPVSAPEPIKLAVEKAEKKVQAAAPIESKQVFEKTDQPRAALATSGGAYSLTAGTYLLDSSVKSVSKKLRSLGYEPAMTPVKRKVTMTRLKAGTYSKSVAATKMAELRPYAPDVFSIREGNSETVYVGSYLVLDKARRFADKLFKKGIKLEEVPVQVTKTLQRVTFGSFASVEEANDVARQVARKGVEAQVYKNR